MPHFQIGDNLVTETGHRFTVTGISKASSGYLYCGSTVGWLPEEVLDYDFTEAQRAVIEDLEHTLWEIRRQGESLERLITKVRNEFDGELPGSVRHELEVVRKIVGEPTDVKVPGALEKSDIWKLLGCTKELMGSAREAIGQLGEDYESMRQVAASLRTALRNVQDQVKNVEDHL